MSGCAAIVPGVPPVRSRPIARAAGLTSTGRVVGVEHHDADPQRVDASCGRARQPGLLLVGDRGPPPAPAGARARPVDAGAAPPVPAGTGQQQTGDQPGRQRHGHHDRHRPLHPAIVGSLLTWLPHRTGQITLTSENVHPRVRRRSPGFIRRPSPRLPLASHLLNPCAGTRSAAHRPTGRDDARRVPGRPPDRQPTAGGHGRGASAPPCARPPGPCSPPTARPPRRSSSGTPRSTTSTGRSRSGCATCSPGRRRSPPTCVR